MIVGVITRCALLQSVWDLKDTLMNVQSCLIRELMLYEFRLNHNVIEATKNICRAKDDGAVDHSTVTRWFKRFCLGYKNLEDQASLGRPETVDSMT